MFGIKSKNEKLREIIKESEELIKLLKEDKYKVVDALKYDLKIALTKVSQMQKNYNEIQDENYRVEDENKELKFEIEKLSKELKEIKSQKFAEQIVTEIAVAKEKVARKPRKKKEVVVNEEKI